MCLSHEYITKQHIVTLLHCYIVTLLLIYDVKGNQYERKDPAVSDCPVEAHRKKKKEKSLMSGSTSCF